MSKKVAATSSTKSSSVPLGLTKGQTYLYTGETLTPTTCAPISEATATTGIKYGSILIGLFIVVVLIIIIAAIYHASTKSSGSGGNGSKKS